MPRISLEPGFVMCESTDIPKVDIWMVTNFFSLREFISAEVREEKIILMIRT